MLKLCFSHILFVLFSGQQTEKIFEPGRFYTKYVSEIESDPVGNFDRCREALVINKCFCIFVSDILILRFRNKMHGFITILYILTYLETSCLVYLH